jgi:alanine dehydrogenase
MLKEMKQGSVLVDVAIDQGGCFETSKATTHAEPTYIIDGVVHYCVANMPGAVAMTSTLALTNATLPYALQLADKGWQKACRDNDEIRSGVNVVGGKVTYKGVADAFGLDHTPIDSFLTDRRIRLRGDIFARLTERAASPACQVMRPSPGSPSLNPEILPPPP